MLARGQGVSTPCLSQKVQIKGKRCILQIGAMMEFVGQNLKGTRNHNPCVQFSPDIKRTELQLLYFIEGVLQHNKMQG